MEKYYYFYNPHQANFFLMNGVPVIEIGKGGKGDVYVKFPKNKLSQEIFSKWVERCNSMK